jgi:hypothetical protein
MKETASKQVRILPSTQPVLNHIRARINLKRMQKKLPELSAADVIDLAVRNLTVDMGVNK